MLIPLTSDCKHVYLSSFLQRYRKWIKIPQSVSLSKPQTKRSGTISRVRALEKLSSFHGNPFLFPLEPIWNNPCLPHSLSLSFSPLLYIHTPHSHSTALHLFSLLEQGFCCARLFPSLYLSFATSRYCCYTWCCFLKYFKSKSQKTTQNPIWPMLSLLQSPL